MTAPENSSSTEGQASPDSTAATSSDASGQTGQTASPVDQNPTRTGELVDEERLAPEAERLAAPSFAAKTIPDPVVSGPSGLFLAIVATASFAADIFSKLWAEKRLREYPHYADVLEGHLTFTLAENRGGAWGLLQGTSEALRRPFFLLVSIAAISFIVTLYRRLSPRQHALRWGLPLVLGGALGNVFDRLRYGHVIDFIDYRAEWVRKLNEFIAKYSAKHVVTDHWPTFNVADIAICVGVGLMAVDMFTSRRGRPLDKNDPGQLTATERKIEGETPQVEKPQDSATS
jgi:lipoprotein signal peptidase